MTHQLSVFVLRRGDYCVLYPVSGQDPPSGLGPFSGFIASFFNNKFTELPQALKWVSTEHTETFMQGLSRESARRRDYRRNQIRCRDPKTTGSGAERLA